MDWKKVDKLKGDGNKAFNVKSYDDSFEFRKEAIELVNSGYNTAASVIHSNIGQAQLMNKNYLSALEHVNKSLELDPSFKKSMLRRAIANCELQNYEEAMKDVRYFFKYDPTNSQVVSLMRCCSDLPKMKQELRVAYVSYYLRKKLYKSYQSYETFGFLTHKRLKISLLRQIFLSLKNLEFVSQLLIDAVIVPCFSEVQLILNSWFKVQFMKLRCHGRLILFMLSDRMFHIIFHLAKPGIFNLVLDTLPKESMFGPWNRYSNVCLSNRDSKFDASDLQMIEQNAEIWTRLLYLPEIAEFKNCHFSNLKDLLFGSKGSPDLNFLKLWQQNQWPIKRLIFEKSQPNLETFKQFDGVISNHVTTLYISFDGIHLTKDIYHDFCNDLAAFKRIFPTLADVNMTVNCSINIEKFSLFIKSEFKQLIRNACKAIDQKPEWCSNLRFLIVVSSFSLTPEENVNINLEMLKKVVNLYRHDLDLKNLRFVGPSISEFSWLSYDCPLYTINFETDAAHFAIEFLPCL